MYKKSLIFISALAMSLSVHASNESLSGKNVVTEVTIPGANAPINVVGIATGSKGKVKLTPAGDGATMNYELTIKRLGSPVESVHIHLGPEGVNGPVLITICDNAGAVPCGDNAANEFALSGAFTSTDLVPVPERGINTVEDFIANLRDENTYIDVHTGTFPDGELRGEIEAKFNGGNDDDKDDDKGKGKDDDDKEDDKDDDSSSDLVTGGRIL
jgi:hypothetical protein